MKSNLTLFSFLLACIVCAGNLHADEKSETKKFSPEEIKIHEEIRQAVAAGLQGDADTLFKYIHPQNVRAAYWL